MARLPDPFPPSICERLRRIAARYKNAVEKHADALAGAKEAVESIQEAEREKAPKKISQAKENHSDYVRKVQRYKHLMKAAQNALIETIEKGDDLKLWEGDVDTSPSERDLLSELNAPEPEPEKPTEPAGEPVGAA